MASATIITVFNHKGGVGKTTTAVNLAAALSIDHGKRCLVVDMDPQANATRSLLSTELPENQPTMRHMLLNKNPHVKNIVLPTPFPSLSLAPADIGLSEAEFKLNSYSGREFILRDALASITPSYDYIIIDCAPSLGLLTLNTLAATRNVIIPCETQFLSLRGLKYVVEILELTKSRLNHSLSLLGLLATKHYQLSRANIEALACMRRLKTIHVFDAVIPRDVKAEEAPSHGIPLIVYAPECRASIAYKKFAEEVNQLCQKQSQD